MKNKIIVVAGGTGGIGSATVKKLKEKNAKVIVLGKNYDKLHNIALELNVDIFSLEICEIEQIELLVKEIYLKYGRIDAFINCIGIGIFGSIFELDDNEINKCVMTNLTGSMILTKHIATLMKIQKGGHIITVESIAAVKSFRFGGIYTATKAGMASFNSALWEEVKKSNIRVTSIRPGAVNTEFINQIAKSEYAIYGLRPEDVAESIIFSLSQPDTCNVSEVTLRPFKIKGQDFFIELLNQKYKN